MLSGFLDDNFKLVSVDIEKGISFLVSHTPATLISNDWQPDGCLLSRKAVHAWTFLVRR